MAKECFHRTSEHDVDRIVEYCASKEPENGTDESLVNVGNRSVFDASVKHLYPQFVLRVRCRDLVSKIYVE
ncbi:hypothetical protein AS032_35020 [Rhodococcus qingshengii]|nr:hypothetical protein AOT96_33000 [Rhodococcus sp. 008]KSU57091.1 hypothetical protein AS032_35020 [Rhodococcus qingshengii]